ncbi:SUN2 protein, partial [Nothoprocta ornata]|nr:SUN2 protein [Nothoprocta ornata]
ITPGQCWSFRGFWGQVVIKLPARIWPTAVTVHHVLEADSPPGSISSTPKDIAISVSPCCTELGRIWCIGPGQRLLCFVLQGLNEEGEATLLGTFSYDIKGEARQVFPLKTTHYQAFQYIQLRIQNNWGNTEYTCLYRVQVHGRIAARN